MNSLVLQWLILTTSLFTFFFLLAIFVWTLTRGYQHVRPSTEEQPQVSSHDNALVLKSEPLDVMERAFISSKIQWTGSKNDLVHSILNKETPSSMILASSVLNWAVVHLRHPSILAVISHSLASSSSSLLLPSSSSLYFRLPPFKKPAPSTLLPSFHTSNHLTWWLSSIADKQVRQHGV